ncbi:hypothetical protein TWF506_003753 [Arthrobotrys conoides]|uniref:Uncharacterized protein n=1 Tax=Arthrobotrys conoides TaxID=74498 RepID=A0AAN8MXZ9_9PEZI
MVNIKQSNEDDLVKAQNNTSRNPLALAVYEYWVDAVRLLIELGADPHDDNLYGGNCFHMLIGNQHNDEKVELEIAGILLEVSVNCAKSNLEGYTPLSSAVRHTKKLYLAEFLLRKYFELGKISNGNTDILIDPMGNIFHWAAENSVADMFHKIQQILRHNGLPLDGIQALLYQVNFAGDTPIHTAISDLDLEVIQEILTTFPDLRTRKSPWGKCFLSNMSEELMRKYFMARSEVPHLLKDPRSDLFKAKEVFAYILECTPPISLFIFEDNLFDRNSTMLQHINLGTISSKYGYPFMDASDTAIRENLHRDIEYNLPKYMTTVFADHPVPPGESFYFEVHISNASRDPGGRYSSQFSDWEDLFPRLRAPYEPFELRIGFQSFGSWQATLLSFDGKGSSLGWFGNGKYVKYEVPEWPLIPGAHTYYVGCGINRLQNEIFQTYNGVVQNVIELKDPGRYTPWLTFAWGYSDVKFNFGTEPSQPEPANDPDRVWDGSFLDSFGLQEDLGP